MRQITSAGCFACLLVISGCTNLPQTSALATLEAKVAALEEDVARADQLEGLREDVDTSLKTTAVANADRLEAMNKSIQRLTTRVAQECKAKPETTQVCEQQQVVLHGDRMVVGEVEKVRVHPPGFVIDARVDTGAESSSLHAENITLYELDGDDWVRFDVAFADESVTIERPIKRHVRVFQQSDKEGTRRPVVDMRILVGNVSDTFEFTLADRSHLKHGMLLGRNFLTDLALVDVGKQFVQPLPKQ